ncbi:MAG: hypothetical protein NC102_00740 [Clostridium sp.]|nr:hypothetical protein [Clostridium sp.]
MFRPFFIIMLLALTSAAAACSAGKSAPAADSVKVRPVVSAVASAPLSVLPKAVIYKMNGDYAKYVPVTLSPSRDQLVSYPAPTDLSENSTPLPLENGWYLDRRGGIGPNTAFLKYTYAQYMSLSAPPSHQELMDAVMPDARVTQVRTLPMTLNAALADTAELRKFTL